MKKKRKIATLKDRKFQILQKHQISKIKGGINEDNADDTPADVHYES